MQKQLIREWSPRMRCIHQMIERGMIQSITIPEKKMGAGRVTNKRRTQDLQLLESTEHSTHTPKIFDMLSCIQKSNPTYYCGFDPTADSLHLGHMTVLSVLLNMARKGCHVIALIGGATSWLGDPQGKTADRKLIQQELLEKNSAALEKQIGHIFSKYAQQHRIDLKHFNIVNNKDWYENMTLRDYIGGVASQIKLAEMFGRAIVKSRLEAEKSDMRFSEFVYQSFQSYDWLQLYTRYGCSVQVGGYDQIGNIEDGYDYIWRELPQQPDLAGITVPLMVTENGEKFGKSSKNAVWLDQSKTYSMSMEEYLTSLGPADLLSVSLKLTNHPLEELQRANQVELTEIILKELMPLLT